MVYSSETLEQIAAVMKAKEEEYRTSIVLISDEPYRELAYDGVEVPYVTPFYHKHRCLLLLQQVPVPAGRADWISGNSAGSCGQ